MTPFRFNMPEGFKFPSNYTNPYSFSGTDANGTYQGGGNMPKSGVPAQYGAGQVRHQAIAPQPSTSAPQGVTVNGVTFPVFSSSDFERSKLNHTFGENSDTYDVWGITQDAAQRYWGAGDRAITQGLTSPLNMPGYTWVGGDAGGYVQKDSNPGVAYNGAAVGGWRDTNYWPHFDDAGNFTGMTIKTAGKHGTYVPYTKNANGQFVPNPSQASLRSYSTNDGNQNRTLAGLAAIAATAGTIGAYMNPGVIEGAAAAGGGAGGTAGIGGQTAAGMTGLPAELGGIEGIIGGSTAAPGVSTGLGTGFAGTAPMTGTLPSVVPGAMTGAGAAGLGPLGTIGAGMPYFASSGAGFGGNAALGVGPAAAGAVPGAGASIPRGALSTVGRVASGLGQLFGGGGAPGGSGGAGGLGGLAGLLGGLYSADGARDYARELRGIASGMREDADPYLKKLLESYQNPNAYFESPDVKARLELEANKLMGIDSSRGRLSNPIERDMLLQKYAAKDIGDYRSGLNTTIGKMYQPLAIAELLAKGSQTDNNQWNNLFKAIGSGGGGNWINDIKDIIDTGGDLWDVISGWWD